MRSKDGKHSNSDDAALFRQSVGEVEPLRKRRRHESTAPKPKARATKRRLDERAVLDESLDEHRSPDIETGDELNFRRDHVPLSTIRRLRRGKIAVQENIDLHGCTRDEARSQLRDFIRHCAANGIRCVRVVHGKGLGSGHAGPVLKPGVNTWLRNWDEVLAFCSAPAADGGTGAVYVLLKSG